MRHERVPAHAAALDARDVQVGIQELAQARDLDDEREREPAGVIIAADGRVGSAHVAGQDFEEADADVVIEGRHEQPLGVRGGPGRDARNWRTAGRPRAEAAVPRPTTARARR